MNGWSNWKVEVYFTINGLKGREIYEVTAEHEKMAGFRGYARFEDEALDEGLPAWECGCCLMPAECGGGLDFVDMKAEKI